MREQNIHDEIRQMLQHIADEYGIRIDSISADWMDISMSDKVGYRLLGLSMDTTTKQ